MKTNFLKPLLLASLVALNVCTVRAETEQELIGILQSNAGAVEKCEACKKLRLVGTKDSVPALAAQLSEERISQAARYALEHMPAPEAGAALRKAVSKTSGLLKAGLVDSVGWRRDASAVPLLKPLLADPDAAITSAAAAALGRIASQDALTALKAARESAAPAVRPAVLEALMRCAQGLLADGKVADAKAIYKWLARPSEPDFIRVAAHAGLLRCAGTSVLTQIKSALQGKDAAAEVAALQLAGGLQDPKTTMVLVGLLPKSQPALQVALLALLPTRGDVAALPAVQAAARSQDAAVRTAAFAALGELGDVTTISLLAEAAASRDADEQKAARQALVSLRRGDVASALVAQLSTASPAVQVELTSALTTRDQQSAVPALLQLARSDRPAVRKAAMRALSKLADGRHAGALVQLLTDAKNGDARDEVVSVFQSLAERLPGGKGLDVEPIVRGLAGGDFETRKALLQVCALFVNEPLRIPFRLALTDSDERVHAAAARALCNARDVAFLPDLLALARQTSNSGLRSLAIEGVVRLATDEAASLSITQRTETLAAAFELASRVEDKRQVLSGLARVPNQTTLELAHKASSDPAVKAEAGAALFQITQKLGFSGPFIQDWLVCGLYRKAGIVGAMAVFNIPFDPEKPVEKVKWHSAPHAEQVNLAALFPGEENCAAYLKAEVIAPEASDGFLLLGSDDGVKAWLNGKLVHANNVDRGDVADQDKANIRLEQGINELLLKITQGGGGWSAHARIVGANGQPIPGLQVASQAGAPPLSVQAPKPPPVPQPATLPPRDAFQKLRLSAQFYAEGAYFGDLNCDGKLDVVAGPFWFEGPRFEKRHEYRPVKAFDPKTEYSDNFLTYVGDFNGDGWPDILVVPFPGKEGYWYENPAGKEGHWKQHLAYDNIGDESPAWGDVIGLGRPQLLFCKDGFLGYAAPDFANPDKPWVFHAISTEDKRYQRFTHGLGFGDINGDKRNDVVEAAGWWEQPAELKGGQPWIWHPFHLADAGAQMYVYDVDGDGLADIITAWHCHLYGLVWWQQVRGADGKIDWRQHTILSPTPSLTSSDFRVSQMHAMVLADVNGDGVLDIVTGKRFWAHGPTGDKEPNAPAVLFWLELRRGGPDGATFIPHLIDDDSGVGTQVAATDLNNDGRPDVIVANKKGIFVFLNQSAVK